MPAEGPYDPTTRPLPQGHPQPPGGGSPHGSPYPPPEYPQQQGYPQQGYPQQGYPQQGYPQRSWTDAGTDHPAGDFDPDATRPLPSSGPGGPAVPPGTRRRGWRSPKVLVPLVGAAVLLLGALAAVVYVRFTAVTMQDPPSGVPTVTGRAAQLPPGRTWLSGAWTGGTISVDRIDGFGRWRGQPADVVTTYPAYKTWKELEESDWHVSTLNEFEGRLSYGLPLLPSEEKASLADVAAGRHDESFRKVAQVLVKNKRQDSFVRIGLEANGTWFPWGADAARAEDFKGAWRRVRDVMKQVAPTLNFGFDITCGKALEGGTDRLDNLNRLYPGDDVVDVVGCDHYDQYHVKSRNQREWERTLRPDGAAGLADVADFARAHGKGLVVPEWGVAAPARDGSGDNPFFVYSMYAFFLQNKDILVYENYFNEADDSLGSAIWGADQNPRASAEYGRLWGTKPNLAAAKR